MPFVKLILALLLAASFAHGRRLHQTTTVTSSSTGTGQTVTSITGLPSGFKWPTFSSNLPATLQPITTPTTLPTPTATLPTTTQPTATTTPTTSTTAPASQTVPSLSGGSCPDPQRALDLHNAERARRAAAPLSWSADLAAGAQAWSSYCRFQHSGAAGLGENLYWSTSDAATCANAASMWADERSLYNGGYSASSGHFTQMVWKATTAVGCGLAWCGSGVIVTCRYSPAGNVLGNFAANV